MKPLPKNFRAPRTHDTVFDWPLGRGQKTIADFRVETNSQGLQRVSRITQKTGGGWSKPRRTPYAPFFLLLTGNDNRIYAVSMNREGFTLWPGTLDRSTYINERNHPELNGVLVSIFARYENALTEKLRRGQGDDGDESTTQVS